MQPIVVYFHPLFGAPAAPRKTGENQPKFYSNFTKFGWSKKVYLEKNLPLTNFWSKI